MKKVINSPTARHIIGHRVTGGGGFIQQDRLCLSVQERPLWLIGCLLECRLNRTGSRQMAPQSLAALSETEGEHCRTGQRTAFHNWGKWKEWLKKCLKTHVPECSAMRGQALGPKAQCVCMRRSTLERLLQSPPLLVLATGTVMQCLDQATVKTVMCIAVVPNPVPGDLPSCRCLLQP